MNGQKDVRSSRKTRKIYCVSVIHKRVDIMSDRQTRIEFLFFKVQINSMSPQEEIVQNSNKKRGEHTASLWPNSDVQKKTLCFTQC